MPENNLNLDKLRALHAAATGGIWKLTKAKSGRWQISNGLVQIAQIWHTVAHPASSTGKAIIALHNAFPALADRLEELEAYRESSEAAMRTMLESGDEAQGEVHQLRDRLEEAERERDERAVMAARAQEAMRYLLNGLPADDAVWAAYGNADSARAWLAARDARMKALGAAEALERLANEECSTVFDGDLPHVTKNDLLEEAARLRREAGE